MASGPMSSGKKLALISAFAVLLVAAFGAGCNGFFTGNTITAVTIQPPSPQFQVGQTENLQAWGTYQDNSRAQITSGVAWTSSGEGTTINIDPNTGELSTPAGSTGGSASITAAAQGLSATATAVALLGNVTNFEACTGTFNTGTCPASTWTVNSGGSNLTQDFYAIATYNGQVLDLTTTATWTPSTTSITCSSSSSPASCVLAPDTAAGNYTITVTYGSNSSASINVSVSCTGSSCPS